MFEQSIVEARALTARPWTLVVSVCGQAVLITAAIVLPLLHPETLRRVVMLVPIGGPPPAYHPPAARVDPVPQAATSPRLFRCTFCAPARIPTTVSMLPDAPSVSGPAGNTEGVGVPGGIGDPGDTIGPASRVTPPQPPPPTPRSVEHPVAPQPVPAPKAPTRVSGGVQASLLIYRPEPVYPPLARQARVSGAVHLTALISTDGRITSLRALDGHPLLVRAAIDAVKQWVYRPTLLNGVPVEVITEITVTFTLN